MNVGTENYKKNIRKALTGNLTSSQYNKLSEESFISCYLEKQWEKVSDEVKDKENCGKRIWQKIARECWGESSDFSSPKRKRSFSRLNYSVAAIIILLIAGAWIYYLTLPSTVTLYAPHGATLSHILPDSSTIWLNSGTTVTYNKNFRKDRTIRLDGEAMFDVNKYKDIPFKVLFEDAVVEVKGTSFNIKSYKQSVNEITLFTGRIEFRIAGLAKTVDMQPSEHIIYDPKTRIVKRTATVPSDFDWRTGIFKFNDKRLGELIEDINRIYNVNVKISQESYYDYLYSGTIKRHENLNDILDKICITLDLHVRVENEIIVLY